ncbi:MAG TPA: branched-chain amino acid ABC transporter substrate-binding protein [Anaerolineales bacterium]|jgi:branched-chain amino acid transport system substrate-binding protein|nr:branched-chain amino acid ABC transporter substrate-binding protein [Anaerolineales bacterium]
MKRLFALLTLLVIASVLVTACAPAATQAPATEEPATEAPATEAPATEAPATEAPATQAGAVDCSSDALGCVDIAPGEPVHLAYWGVLSGADGTLGEDSKRGVEIAIDDAGGEFHGHEILLTTEDALCTPEGGATAATKLATDTSIVALVGSACSDETVGGVASITNAGLTTISPSNTRPALTDPNRGPDYDGYLRTAHSDAFQGKAVAEFAYNVLGARKAATIHDGSAYAEALQQVFADNFVELGGEIVAQEAVAKDATDMRPVLTSIAAAGPEFLYYPVFVAAGGFITAQVREISGLEDVKLAGSDGIFTPDFLEAAGPNVEGMYLSSPDFSAFPEGYASFIEKHNAKYGGAPLSIFHAHAYDATNIILAALEQVVTEDADGTLHVPRQALRDAIYATKDFKGITGTLSCSPTGDCGAPVIAVYEVVNADPASWNPQDAANPNPKKIYP